MKSIKAAMLLVVVALCLLSCKEKAIYKTFETQYTFKSTVPANALLASPLFPISFEETSNAEAEYALNDTRKDLVDEVFVNSFLIEVENPQSEDLSFLNSIHLYINADAEPEMLVASKDPVPVNVAQDLALDLEHVNLATYLRKEPFQIRTRVVTDENRTQDIVLRGTVRFTVKARILGKG